MRIHPCNEGEEEERTVDSQLMRDVVRGGGERDGGWRDCAELGVLLAEQLRARRAAHGPQLEVDERPLGMDGLGDLSAQGGTP